MAGPASRAARRGLSSTSSKAARPSGAVRSGGDAAHLGAEDTVLQRSAAELAEALRQQGPPVIARVEEGALLLDLRTVDPGDDRTVAEALVRALGGRARPLA